jgi:hypothetical protein
MQVIGIHLQPILSLHRVEISSGHQLATYLIGTRGGKAALPFQFSETGNIYFSL